MNRWLLMVLLIFMLIAQSCAKHEEVSMQSTTNPDSTGLSNSDSNYYYSFSLDTVTYHEIAFVNNYSFGDFGNTNFTGAAILPPGDGIFSGNSILDTTDFGEIIGNIPSGL